MTPRGVLRQRQRHASRRAAECDALPGMGLRYWRAEKAKAERRMAIIDPYPPELKALLNDYPHQEVARVVEDCWGDLKQARRSLEQRFGRTG